MSFALLVLLTVLFCQSCSCTTSVLRWQFVYIWFNKVKYKEDQILCFYLCYKTSDKLKSPAAQPNKTTRMSSGRRGLAPCRENSCSYNLGSECAAERDRFFLHVAHFRCLTNRSSVQFHKVSLSGSEFRTTTPQ